MQYFFRVLSMALDDLKKALELNPSDIYVQREILALKVPT
jgi:hypothetical protein